LKRFFVGPMELDACDGGCGGVWFDASELDKLNAAVPAGHKPLAEITRDPDFKLDEQSDRKCVRCRGVKLERKLFSLGTGVIMDQCPKCQGVWLDHGELETIRQETHPIPHKPRHVVKRITVPQSIPIDFQVVQQVQTLRIQK